MQIMKILMLFLSLFYFGNAFANTNNCVPTDDSCEYYLCLEQELSCGYKGFPLRYGYRFCQNFLDIRTKSEELKGWLDKTRICLQDQLNNMQEKTCSNLFSRSINDHVQCYVDNGFCNLSKRDQNKVKRNILKEFLTAPIYIIKNARKFLKNKCTLKT